MTHAYLKYFPLVLATVLCVCGFPCLASGAPEGPKIVARQKQDKIVYRTPTIPYPYQALRNRITGEGVIQVVFDVQGNAARALMIKSTHSGVLDSAATQYAKAYWKSSQGNASTLEVPLEFTLTPPPSLKKTVKISR